MCAYFRMIIVVVLTGVLFFSGTRTYAAETEFTAYLFAFFTGNSGNEEAIRFALSDDGHTYKALNKKNPVLRSSQISSTGGVRDPHILRGEDNNFYMVATDMVSANGWASNRGLVMLKSTNLVDWTSSTVHIPSTFSTFASVDRVWAPQVIYDREAGRYMLYFSMRRGSGDADKIYYTYADSAFTTLQTEPEVLYSYNGKSSIDGDIIYKDSTYHLFFKTEGSGNGIKSALSSSLTGEYQLYDKYLQLTSDAVEGSCVFKLIATDTYVLMYDMYMSGTYEFALSTDLKNFTADPTPVSFDFKPRHGTVIPITDAEKNALNAKWNPTVLQAAPVNMARRFLVTHCNGSLQITTQTPGARVLLKIMNLTGALVVQRNLSATGRVDLSRLSSGVYEVRVETGTRQHYRGRIVVW